MNKFKKIVFMVSFVAVLCFSFNFSVPAANALTADEIRAQIALLMAQISELQKQLDQTEVWCHTFNSNLKYGDTCQGSGDDCEILQLQNALNKEGIQGAYKDNANASGGIAIFAEHTASAVVGFQQKYKQDILAPWGLEYGTGYVGKTTREKLNELYGCGTLPDITCENLWWYDNNIQYCQQKQFCGAFMYLGLRTFATKQECETALAQSQQPTPSITVTSPNGGEQWMIGETYDITWNSAGLNDEYYIDIRLNLDSPSFDAGMDIGKNVLAKLGKYSWTIPNSLEGFDLNSDGNKYKIELMPIKNQVYVYDFSDNYFSIVAAQPVSCHTTPLWDWAYCSPGCKCDAGEGDCDTDADCVDGLYCAKNVGVNYTQDLKMDVCEAKATTCTDTDGGRNYYMKGTAKFEDKTSIDYCVDENTVAEYWCTGMGGVEWIQGPEIYTCLNGCADGACAEEQPASITVLSPNGGEQWVVGNTYEITWNSTGVDRIAIDLDYFREETKNLIIFSDNPGFYNWTIPLDYQLSDECKISVRAYSLEVYVSDASDRYFSIVAAEPITCHTSDLWSWNYCSPSCKCDAGEGDCDTDADCADGLYCAKNVGVNYTQVSTMDVCEVKPITCADTDNGKDYYTSGYGTGIYPIHARDGYFIFSADYPGGQKKTSNEKFDTYYDYCLNDTQLNEAFCDGNTLSAHGYQCPYGCANGACKPGITVISPNGGEEWVVGSIYDITWESSGSIGIVRITLIDGTANTASLSQAWYKDNVPNTGIYNFVVPNIPSKNQYKIHISFMDSTDISDSSDNYFSIVAAEPVSCHTSDLWDWNYCSPSCKCDAGEGDCDTDADCADGLYCAKNVGVNYGQTAKMDVCEVKISIICVTGMILCNGNCVNIMTDLNNCGSCGNQCPSGNVICENGICEFMSGPVASKDLGVSCSEAYECESGFCVDGVCCNNTCAGRDCQTCGELSSQGIGHCGFVNSSSADPRNDCVQGSTAADGCKSDNCSGKNWSCGVVQNHNDGGCPVCKTCDGINATCKSYADNTQDVNAQETCQGCKQCMNGDCVNIANGQDLFGECFTTGCGNGNCNGNGECGWLTQGEGKCPACKTCNGATSLSCKYISKGQKDTQGNEVCYEAYPGEHYRCNGHGGCTAPVDLTQTDCLNWGSNNCAGYCPTWCSSESMCKKCWGSSMRIYSNNACSGTGSAVYSGSCNQSGGSCKCFYERYQYE